MAVAAILAMVHDVVISVGIYSLFGFVVTPATVIAFLTILGYSLYDTIVVFDRGRKTDTIRPSEGRVRRRCQRVDESSTHAVDEYVDLISASGDRPSGDWLRCAWGLNVERRDRIAYRHVDGNVLSVFVASPTLATLKLRAEGWKKEGVEHVQGEDLRTLVLGGSVSRRARSGESAASKGSDSSPSSDAASVLQHDPRPRKKRRR